MKYLRYDYFGGFWTTLRAILVIISNNFHLLYGQYLSMSFSREEQTLLIGPLF